MLVVVVERKKELVGEGLARPSSQRKKLEKQEEQLKNYNRDLTMVGRHSSISVCVIGMPVPISPACDCTGQDEIHGCDRILLYRFVRSLQFNVRPGDVCVVMCKYMLLPSDLI